MSDTVFLSGATGLLGTETALALLSYPEIRVYALVRGDNSEHTLSRLKGAWAHERALYDAIGKQFFAVNGDFSKDSLGLSEKDLNTLSDEVTIIIHTGAETGFAETAEHMYETNVCGTRNMTVFAKKCRNLRRFVHVSTAYVSGTLEGLIKEESVRASEYSNHYELSKAEAERIVTASELPVSIVRPGMIVGDSKTGWTRNFNTVYYLMKLLLKGQLPLIPVKADTVLNLVPADYVAESLLKICFEKEAEGKIFHVTCPEESAPCAKELADYVCAWAERELDLKIHTPAFSPLPLLKKSALKYSRKAEAKQKDLLHNIMTLAPYFFAQKAFDRTNTDAFCGRYNIDWHDYIDVLLAFACRKNFMRQDGKTVFEQAMVRRTSRRYPVSYYDVTSDGIIKTEGPEANKRIKKIVSALLRHGIRKGDRIALSGINSAEYMCLDQAIGLIGAVSVPIYYTSPARETSLLLERSGSKWFFIGDKRMMSHLPEITSDACYVSFSAAENIADSKAITFTEFLRTGNEPIERQYPCPDDLATIRYTSGTTGEPKGVTFTYGQLAWMGEVLTTLLTWKDRNESMRYLSFLPLSHVVEGILASYAPYYVLCRVDYYFLNDFGALTDSLPKVRPNVFFSVPRFYEKVWDQVVSNPIGKIWLKEKDGIGRKATGRVLKTAVLKKAGLDQCSQLIVGSAPVSEALLLSFRNLGIEIHNAYGQTEAPLITINRLHDNIIPTIGTPLPETEVTVEEDGELIVRGPQVTPGYYGLESPNIKDGVLRTGDLGTIDEYGHITLFGRKKDFVVTSYGKNISIPKLEEALKDIPGVSEAVMIGEGRPYCTALLWLEKDIDDLDAEIEKINAKLSHPEQIRKYRIIETPLSIAREELTPNLKVKRRNVEEHYKEEIAEMYA